MGSTLEVYPVSHDLALQRVMQVIDLIGAHPDITDEDAIASLLRDGIGDVDAELLIRFVPCGLAFALLKLMGLNKFPSTYKVQDRSGHWVELPLAAENYFSVALSVGYDVTTEGYTERISKEKFQAVSMRSAEMKAVNKYFESGGTLEKPAGGTLGPPTFIGIKAEQIAASRKIA